MSVSQTDMQNRLPKCYDGYTSYALRKKLVTVLAGGSAARARLSVTFKREEQSIKAQSGVGLHHSLPCCLWLELCACPRTRARFEARSGSDISGTYVGRDRTHVSIRLKGDIVKRYPLTKLTNECRYQIEFEDPRTGIWTSASGETVQALYKGFDRPNDRVLLKTLGGKKRTIPLQQLVRDDRDLVLYILARTPLADTLPRQEGPFERLQARFGERGADFILLGGAVGLVLMLLFIRARA